MSQCVVSNWEAVVRTGWKEVEAWGPAGRQHLSLEMAEVPELGWMSWGSGEGITYISEEEESEEKELNSILTLQGQFAKRTQESLKKKITQRWEVELDYRKEDDEFGFRQVKLEIMVVPHASVMKISEIKEWSLHEELKRIWASVPFPGEDASVRPAEELSLTTGGTASIQLRL